jgi:TrmH family RNA methyltransferase
MRRVTSRQNPLIATFRAVARGDQPGLFLDGPHLIAEALAGPIRIKHVMVTHDGMARPEVTDLVSKLEGRSVDLVSVPPRVMAAVSSVRSSSAIVAIADRPAATADLYAATPLVVIACDVQDPGNLGAIVRVAEAAGGTGLVAAGRSADPFGPKALRGSMGSAFRLPMSASDAATAMSEARRRGCRVLAAIPRGGRSLFELDLTRPVAVLIGGEGAGLPTELRTMVDECFTIPMRPAVESLNAAVTAALVLYEAFRQREQKQT